MIHSVKKKSWAWPQSSKKYPSAHSPTGPFLVKIFFVESVTEDMHLQKKKSFRKASINKSTKVSSLTTQHLSVSTRFKRCRAPLMSIHDAKTLGEPISSSSNTKTFLARWVYLWYRILKEYPHLIKASHHLWNNKFNPIS